MKFKEGKYYVGDLTHVLIYEDLREVFWNLIRYNKAKPGVCQFVAADKYVDGEVLIGCYWITNLETVDGTLYDQYGRSWGFDSKIFGCAPVEFILDKKQHSEKILDFKEPFECSHIDGLITIGHLNFTLYPQ